MQYVPKNAFPVRKSSFFAAGELVNGRSRREDVIPRSGER
jgi:hypothetical protein